MDGNTRKHVRRRIHANGASPISAARVELNGFAGAHAERNFFAPPFNISDRVGKNGTIYNDVGAKSVVKRKSIAGRNGLESADSLRIAMKLWEQDYMWMGTTNHKN